MLQSLFVNTTLEAHVPNFIAPELEQTIRDNEVDLATIWANFEDIKNHCQIKVLNAFQEAGIQNVHYSWVTGYGYDDLGKDKLDQVFAKVFNTEAAIVRPQIVSGTHAIASGSLGPLNEGDERVMRNGAP